MLPFNFFGGHKFPYTNFHDLNLDWLITTVKELFGRTEKVEEDVQNCTQYIEDVDSEIQQKIDDEIPTAVQQAIQSGLFNEVLTASRTRRFLFIGDSYAEGWTPDGTVTGFPTIVKSLMHISDGNFFSVHKGGAKFGAISGSEYAFDEVLNSYLPSITHKESITDIIFAGGYNDVSSTDQSIRDGIQRCKSLISANFTNPSLKVYMFAIGYHAISPSNRYTLWKKYNECYAQSGWAYTKLTQSICYDDWWASDGYHPNANAQNAIATQIVNILEGGTQIRNCVNEEYALTSLQWENAKFYSFMDSDAFDSILYGRYILYDTPITLNSSTPVKIFEITSKLPLSNTGDASKQQKYFLPCIVQVGNSYQNHILCIYLEQSDRRTFNVMANLFEANTQGTNYTELTNVVQIQVLLNSLHIRIPYQF